MEAFDLAQCCNVRVGEEHAKLIDLLGIDLWGAATGSLQHGKFCADVFAVCDELAKLRVEL